MSPGGRLTVLKIDPGHLVSARRPPVPRSAHGDERIAAILFGESRAFIEGHLHGRSVGRITQQWFFAQGGPLLKRHPLGRVVLRVEVGEIIHIGPTELLALLDKVEFLLLFLVAEPIGAVIGSEQTARRRFPIESNGVAQTTGEDRAAGSVRLGSQNGGILGIGFGAGVAGRSSADIEHAVRPHRQGPVGVLAAVGQIVD